MFFVVSNTIGLLTRPLVLGFVLLIMFAVIRRSRPKVASRLFFTTVIFLYLVSIRPGADLLLGPLEGPFAGYEEPSEADALVSLGGGTVLALSDGSHIEMSASCDRVLAAIELAKRFPDAVVVFSGGTSDLFDQSRQEAPLLKSYAERMGIAAGRIRAESRSRNTYENAVETKRLLESEPGIETVVVITSARHMRRSVACFEKVGIDPTAFPVDFRSHYPHYDILSLVPRVTALLDATGAIHEYCGLVMYKVKGYI